MVCNLSNLVKQIRKCFPERELRHCFPRYTVKFAKKTIYITKFMFAGYCTANSDCTTTDELCLNVGTETAACKRKLCY